MSCRVLSPGALASCPRRSRASIRFCGASATDLCRIEAKNLQAVPVSEAGFHARPSKGFYGLSGGIFASGGDD